MTALATVSSPPFDRQSGRANDPLREPFSDGIGSMVEAGESPLESDRIREHIAWLRDRLYKLQYRLGTPFETCADLDEARAITHSLRNYLQVRELWNSLSPLEPTDSVGQAKAGQSDFRRSSSGA